MSDYLRRNCDIGCKTVWSEVLCIKEDTHNSLIRLLSLFIYIMDKTGTAVNKVKTLLKS